MMVGPERGRFGLTVFGTGPTRTHEDAPAARGFQHETVKLCPSLYEVPGVDIMRPSCALGGTTKSPRHRRPLAVEREKIHTRRRCCLVATPRFYRLAFAWVLPPSAPERGTIETCERLALPGWQIALRHHDGTGTGQCLLIRHCPSHFHIEKA